MDDLRHQIVSRDQIEGLIEKKYSQLNQGDEASIVAMNQKLSKVLEDMKEMGRKYENMEFEVNTQKTELGTTQSEFNNRIKELKAELKL